MDRMMKVGLVAFIILLVFVLPFVAIIFSESPTSEAYYCVDSSEQFSIQGNEIYKNSDNSDLSCPVEKTLVPMDYRHALINEHFVGDIMQYKLEIEENCKQSLGLQSTFVLIDADNNIYSCEVTHIA